MSTPTPTDLLKIIAVYSKPKFKIVVTSIKRARWFFWANNPLINNYRALIKIYTTGTSGYYDTDIDFDIGKHKQYTIVEVKEVVKNKILKNPIVIMFNCTGENVRQSRIVIGKDRQVEFADYLDWSFITSYQQVDIR